MPENLYVRFFILIVLSPYFSSCELQDLPAYNPKTSDQTPNPSAPTLTNQTPDPNAPAKILNFDIELLDQSGNIYDQPKVLWQTQNIEYCTLRDQKVEANGELFLTADNSTPNNGSERLTLECFKTTKLIRDLEQSIELYWGNLNEGDSGVFAANAQIIIGHITISNIINLNGYTSLKQIKGNLSIVNVKSTTFSAFQALETITGNLLIASRSLPRLDEFDNPVKSIRTLENFSQLKTIGGHLDIFDNKRLSTLGFERLEVVYGRVFSFTGNYSLACQKAQNLYSQIRTPNVIAAKISANLDC